MSGKLNCASAPVCGVVVTYHPDNGELTNLGRMASECGRLVVVDNGSSPVAEARLREVSGAEVIALQTNVGLATALNLGALRAAYMGFRWIVTFDQDSHPQPGMVAAMQATAERNPSAAVVVPRIIEPSPGALNYRWVRSHPRVPGLFQRVACTDADLPDVTMAVSSGSLINLDTWTQLGGFDEDLFIDYVDIDYCLKIIRAGRTIAVSAGARLEHKLGARQPGVVLGHEFRPTHHPAFRHYYMARNRVRIWKRHARAVPHWALFDLCFAMYNALRVIALEPEKWLKLKAVLLGTWDGVHGRSGPCPDWRRRAFQ